MSQIAEIIENQTLAFEQDLLQQDDADSKFLSFVVANEEFAVKILSVQEIRAWEQPTFLPNSPCFVKGVINLRGTIVPVIDLRLRFNFQKADYLTTTVIIILKDTNNKRERLMGCVVDGVSDVFNIEASEVKDLPNHCGNIDHRLVEGVMSVDDHAVTLLNLKNLLSLSLIEHAYSGGIVTNE
jgi:purine-binding chemotaxis protein CheW